MEVEGGGWRANKATHSDTSATRLPTDLDSSVWHMPARGNALLHINHASSTGGAPHMVSMLPRRECSRLLALTTFNFIKLCVVIPMVGCA